MKKIPKEISIEELIEILPESVKFLKDKGIRCIVCGESIWGTLEEAAKEKNFSEEEIAKLIKELNALASTN
jgi:hypothetical protein